MTDSNTTPQGAPSLPELCQHLQDMCSGQMYDEITEYATAHGHACYEAGLHALAAQGEVAGWVPASTRLPEPYADVLVRRKDGTQRAARLNRAGNWELATYRDSNRYQYMADDVVTWFDTATVPPVAAEPSASIRLAEQVLHMDMVTERGKRARELARQVLSGNDEALRYLRLIEHATAPSHDDGGYHEAAHDLASQAIQALASTPQPAEPAVSEATFQIALHEWAVAGWRSEVQNRPLVNVRRKRLDDFWRHAICKAGGDPSAIVGRSHDELIAESRANVASAGAASLAVPEGLVPIGWQFRFVFPTHTGNWRSVLDLPMGDMRNSDGCAYETRYVYATPSQITAEEREVRS